VTEGVDDEEQHLDLAWVLVALEKVGEGAWQEKQRNERGVKKDGSGALTALKSTLQSRLDSSAM
jgi:hypothetical protein